MTSEAPVSRMTPFRWCAAYFAILLAALLGIASLNYAVDFYGLFRDSRQRAIRVYANERTGKYLLSFRYIPENFQGILIGTSVSDNWDIAPVDSIRIYNASVAGANISEEKLIADNALARGHIRLAVFCIHPYLTMNHGRKTDYMDPREYWGALGSIQLLRDYTGATLAKVLGAPAFANANGVGRSEAGADEAEARARWRRALQHAEALPTEIGVDEQAFREYAALLRSARAHGAVVVGFMPPVYAPSYRVQRAAYQAYFARFRALFSPHELVIDFNAEPYARLAADPATFYDGTHLSDQGAKFFAGELTRQLQEELARQSHGPTPEAGASHASAYRYSTKDAMAPFSPRTLGLVDSMR